MKWRVIKHETHNPYMNVALEEAIIESITEGGPPTIRFYEWDPSSVIIGYFQNIHDEVDLEKCRELGVHCVRRITGGGATLLDKERELTYSVYAPADLITSDITKSYRIICGWLINSLSKIGIEAEFKPINDIVVTGKKISGTAATLRKGVLLVHGTLLYDLDLRKMFSVLKVGQEKISDKFIQAVEERVTCVRHHKDVSKDEVKKALVEGFTEGKDFYFGSLTDKEFQRAKHLVEAKFATHEWNFRR